jgi:Holliday junction resolvase RusA-like endonuclease
MNCPICKSKAIFTKKARLICSNKNCASRGGTEQQKQVLKAKKPERVDLPILVLDVANIRLIGVNKRYCNTRYNLSTEYRNQKDKDKGLASLIIWDRQPMTRNVWVKIEVDTAKDIDAIIKPVLDILQDCGVFENDKQVTELMVSKNTISNKKLESIKVWVCEV